MMSFVIDPIIDRLLIWWLRSGRYNWSWLRRRLFERHYLATILPSANSLEEIQRGKDEFKKQFTHSIQMAPEYIDYYLGTPIEDVFLLSTQRLGEECYDFLEKNAPPNWKDKDFDWRQPGIDQIIHHAAYVMSCCAESFEKQRVIWFSG